MFVFEIEHADVRAECGEHVEQRGAGGVEAERVEDEVGTGEERGGAEEEGGRGHVTGDGGFDGVQVLAAGDGNGIAGAGEGRAKRAEGELAVVASADRFANGGGAACLESGEEQSGFDLGAGDGRGVVDGGKGCAVDRDGRVAFGEFYARAHLRERLADAFHGAAAERGVADEGEGARLRCDQARQHAHGRAGVAAVEGMVRGGEVAGGSDNFDCVVSPRNLGAEGGDTGEGGGTVGAGGEIGKARGPVGESAQQCVTVAILLSPGRRRLPSILRAGWMMRSVATADNRLSGSWNQFYRTGVISGQ